MISILLVSHSKKIAEGLKEMIEGMTSNQEFVTVIALGGSANGGFGTDLDSIHQTLIERITHDEAILIFTDLGSSSMIAEQAVDKLDKKLRKQVHLIDAPLVEGAFITASQLVDEDSLEDVLDELDDL